ncbi:MULTISPECIES: CoA ester lyase [unclassified Methylophilus]|jgi:citrate lyase subunit beta / citryl-CoA lyase|uniref:HpcH/HpaI aldolase/citrate lyase family protein n=1 Tax=unclassified Methylophilus TaxID=2630143 RepID=UPI000A951053|nr:MULTISPECIES: CoA ester lyase [unclassified Methylophilus]
MPYPLRPRRSMLYVPGCNTHYLERARTLAADSVILDLGDPILIDAKLQSRDNVVQAVKQGGYGKREVVIRVNDLDSIWGHDDIQAVANVGADAILFPNIESREDVLRAQQLLDAAGGKDVPMMVMIESPLAVLNAKEIAAASERVICMVMATSDLISQLHARVTHERSAILTSLSLVILAARAYGKGVIDGITSDFKNMHSFEYACRIGRDIGMDGKSLVHPAQIAYCNDAYTPQRSEVEHARLIIKALKEANEAGRGTVVVNDKLVEHHHIKAAQRLIQLAEAISELEEEFI